MKPRSSPVTLRAIGKLIDRKFDQRLGPVNKNLTSLNIQVGGLNTQVAGLNTKIVGIYGELDGIKQQITGLDTKRDSVASNLEAHRKETKEGFDTVFDGLDNIGRTLDKDHEPRIKRLKTKVFVN